MLISALFLSMPAMAQEEKEDSAPAKEVISLPQAADYNELRLMSNTAFVDQVIDPLRVRLKDGTIVQLAGLDVPGIETHTPGENAIGAKEMLDELLTGKQVYIYQTRDENKGRTNRMGYALAHLKRKEGDVWVQGALLLQGFARIFPSERNIEMADAMLALEATAIQNNAGLWADPAYSVMTPDTAEKALNGWGVVTGTVKKIGAVKNTIYLNFGDDWRTDFTIVIDTQTRKQLGRRGIDPMQLANKPVRVHGWLEEYNGPSIKLSHGAWLEVLPEPTK